MLSLFFFFFIDTATTDIYTLSLHDALPISAEAALAEAAQPDPVRVAARQALARASAWDRDRKSTRLNSSHLGISYAVFCLKKKKNTKRDAKRPKYTTKVGQPTTEPYQ